MEHTIDSDKACLRKDKIEGIVSSHLKEKYADIIVNVECEPLYFSLKGVVTFHFFVDIDYSRVIVPNSIYNRIIKKEISNLCQYILGECESYGSTYFNSVIHAVITP